MLSDKMAKAINDQINRELWSAYLYLSMSMYAENKGLKGIANWFFIQFREEQDHARIFMNYLNARGAQVLLQPIDAVQTTWESIAQAFADTLEHERKVTGFINGLAKLAQDENDFASQSMLRWFIDEQVEEEESVGDILNVLEQIKGMNQGLYMLDKDLATRTYNVPSPLANKA